MKQKNCKTNEKKKLVLHIIYDLSVAGAQTVVMNYLREMENDDEFDVGVIVRDGLKGTVYEEEVVEKGYFVDFCDYQPYQGNRIVRPIVNWIRCVKLLRRKINQYKPDIIHTHLANIVPFASIASVHSTTKVKIHTLHSDPEAIEKRYSIWTFLAIHLFGFFPICVTEEQAEKAKKIYKIDDIKVIRNGLNQKKYKVDESKFEIRKELKIPAKNYVIGFVGTLCPIKNIDYLIDLFYDYHKTNLRSSLLIVGDGSEKNRLIQYCESLGIIDSVFFVGQRNDVERMYKSMDLFMLTSTFESSSIVTVEAQMSGVPCLVSDAIPRSVLFSNDSKSISLSSKKSVWLDAMDDIQGTNQKDKSIEVFTLEYAIQELKKVYKNLLRGK